jgi:hypothetical protein
MHSTDDRRKSKILGRSRSKRGKREIGEQGIGWGCLSIKSLYVAKALCREMNIFDNIRRVRPGETRQIRSPSLKKVRRRYLSQPSPLFVFYHSSDAVITSNAVHYRCLGRRKPGQ